MTRTAEEQQQRRPRWRRWRQRRRRRLGGDQVLGGGGGGSSGIIAADHANVDLDQKRLAKRFPREVRLYDTSFGVAGRKLPPSSAHPSKIRCVSSSAIAWTRATAHKSKQQLSSDKG